MDNQAHIEGLKEIVAEREEHQQTPGGNNINAAAIARLKAAIDAIADFAAERNGGEIDRSKYA